MSQLRGLGQARPALAASSGTASASVGLPEEPPTQLRVAWAQRCQPSARTGAAGAATRPRNLRPRPCRRRPSRGGKNGWPVERKGPNPKPPARAGWRPLPRPHLVGGPGRQQSVPTRHAVRRLGRPEGRSIFHRRRRAPRPAWASRRAQEGGANSTWAVPPPPWATTGRPAKSEGSRIEAITVSQGKRRVSCQPAHYRCLACARRAPQQYRHVGRDGQGERFDDGGVIFHLGHL